MSEMVTLNVAEEQWLTDLSSQKDRSLMILIAAMIEDQLEEMLCAFLAPELTSSKAKKNEIFGPNGPLGSLSSMTKICFGVRIIQAVTRDAIDSIRKERNKAAHQTTYRLDGDLASQLAPVRQSQTQLVRQLDSYFEKAKTPPAQVPILTSSIAIVVTLRQTIDRIENGTLDTRPSKN